MENYVMPVKAIKRIFLQELEGHYSQSVQRVYGDTPRAFLHFGYNAAKEQADKCETYDDLDTVIGEWYRMTLREWIESL